MQRLISTLVCCCFLSGYPAYPWWETAHRTVARIAAAHLSAITRTRVARILGVPDDSQAVADALAFASTWADETKNQTNTGAWHYVNLTLEDRKSDIPERCQDHNCAPARIRIFAAQLSSRVGQGRYSELEALRYVVHFVGDIHQPLHTISNADLGGNCEQLNPPLDTAKNLHALWDGAIVKEINPDDKSLTADLEDEIDGFSALHRHRLSRGDEDDWVWESHELANRVIYQRLDIPIEPVEFPHSCNDAPVSITAFKPQVDSDYVTSMKPIVRMQLIKAGLRLARLLNESL
jgi:S1/P1 Nuclease